jgi:hypothetical protein
MCENWCAAWEGVKIVLNKKDREDPVTNVVGNTHALQDHSLLQTGTPHRIVVD